ncbi:hypothetical protein LPJ76_003528 [Coemansia sp. RSA 638]|nr:hypothetical protein LPJ76_003528 [Coemansia sp. RSA 638]
MQCQMIGKMLRRSRPASGIQSSHVASPHESSEGMVDILNNAVFTLASTVQQVSSEMGSHSDPQSASRKRSRIRHSSALPDAFDGAHLSSESLSATTPPTKRRGRPPRDYGEELGPAFAVYASENYRSAEQSTQERTSCAPGTRPPKHDVLRTLWDMWWLSAQNMKDKYLGLSRQEMAVNETHMIELLVDYPLPSEAVAAQAGLRNSTRTISRSPEPISAFDVFLREQIPMLRSRVPDWSETEIRRRLTASWNTMAQAERDKYNVAAVLTATGSMQHGMHPALATTPTNGNHAPRGSSSSTGHKHGTRTPAQSIPRRAYVLFCRQERPLLVQANPEWDLPTVNKELGRKWKELTPAQKEVFHDLERKEYEARAMAAGATPGAHGADGYSGPGYPRNGAYYSGISTPTGSGKSYGRDVFAGRPGRSGAPGSGSLHKGPSKAYVFYSRLNRKGVTSEHPEWDLATVNRELGRMWKVLSLDERHTWEARAAAVAAGTAVEIDSASSTPQPRASPAISTQAVAASTVTPSPIPTAQSMNSENVNGSIPATPVSDTTTPTAREDVNMAEIQEYDGEGEVEDVEMQDDETEDDGSRIHPSQFKVLSQPVAPHSLLPVSAVMVPAAQGPTAAPVTLPHSQFAPVSVPLAGPPPTAKPAVISNGTSSVASTPSLHESASHGH